MTTGLSVQIPAWGDDDFLNVFAENISDILQSSFNKLAEAFLDLHENLQPKHSMLINNIKTSKMCFTMNEIQI